MFTTHTQQGSPSNPQFRTPLLASDRDSAIAHAPTDSQAAPFAPSPTLESKLVEQLADPHASLYDIADDHETSVEALSLWMTRPEVAARIDAIESVVLRRARFVARNFLPAAAHSAAQILSIHQVETSRIATNSTPRDTLNRRRAHETALRAANTLLRIANFTERRAKRQPEAPSRREGIGGGDGESRISKAKNATAAASPRSGYPPSDSKTMSAPADPAHPLSPAETPPAARAGVGGPSHPPPANTAATSSSAFFG